MAGTQEEFESILESCLDRLQSGDAPLETILVEYPDLADELRPLLETVDWFLAKKASLAPRPEFISTSKQNLLARLQGQQFAPADLGAKSLQPGFFERMRQRLFPLRQPMNRRVVLQFVTIVVLLLGTITGGVSTAYASNQALPGEVLYPVKISLEQVELFFSLDAANDVYLHMQFAQLRTQEMRDLVTLNRYLYLRDTLTNYQYHVSESIRLVSVVADKDLAKAKALAPDVHRLVMEQPAILKKLAQSVPEQVFPGLVPAVQVAEDWVQDIVSVLQELEIELTPTPGVDNTALPSSTSTDTQTPQPTGTTVWGSVTTSIITRSPTTTRTQTPTGTASLFPVLVKTSTKTPRPGSTRVPPEFTLTFTATFATPSKTLPPTATSTSLPKPTNTSPPTATSTIPPPPTATSTIPLPPTATATVPPPPTATTPPPPPTATLPPYP